MSASVTASERDHVALLGSNPRKPTKWKRVLAALLAGRSMNRFQTERELSEHVLPTTVAKLQAKGLVILRRDEIVPGYQGLAAHVCRYWLAPESRSKAAELLGLDQQVAMTCGAV